MTRRVATSTTMAGLGVALALAALPSRAEAFEIHSALSIGGGYRFMQEPLNGPLFSAALRVDLLFGRSSLVPRSWGIGPFLSVRGDNFRDVSPAAGASLLFPLHESFPLILSLGGAMRFDARGTVVGGIQRLWFGARSYNQHGLYTFAMGVFVEAREFADAGTASVDVIGGLDIDLSTFALPFIALYSLLFQRRE